ncbi:MAG: SDR family oxidoreductase [Planctomycetes bacterium]|nr:SDR family oxidoreductase [Planctomycetota bacterium]
MTRSASDALLSLEGRRILVTGGAGGIGRAIVEQFDRFGAHVISVDRETHDAPHGVEVRACDLASSAAVRDLIAGLNEVDPLDGLVHSCGITRDGFLSNLDDRSWSSVLATNLDSAFWLLREMSPSMRASGRGTIVMLASINGERGKKGQANYAASKAGLIGLMKSAARELGPFGVRANAIAPGWIDTPMTADVPSRFREQAIRESALERVGQPRDVADAALFLTSDWSRHITGQVLRVDGGQLTA